MSLDVLHCWPETWPFSINLLPLEVYLVGGSVRDRLLRRQASYLDLDFVLPVRAIETASEIARACSAGFVVLDEARQIARVVFAKVTVDFAQQQGDHIETDLLRRDFTMNAIAYNPHRQKLIDPLGGEADIAAGILRMVSTENLAEDPLRLLRAYRQSAQLGFTLAPETQTAIGELAPHLQTISAERIRSELDALLSVPTSKDAVIHQARKNTGYEQLSSILHQQLLQFCLPHFTANSIEQMVAIDGAIMQLEKVSPAYVQALSQWLKPVPAGFYRSWIKAAKLSRLLGTDVTAAQSQLSALKYSRNEVSVVLTLLRVQPYIAELCRGGLNRAQQFFLFKAAAASFLPVALLALAQGADITVVQPLIEKFLDPEDAIAHAQPLITGTTLMTQLGLKPGPKIGKLIKAVEQAQAEGTIASHEEAIAWVKQLSE